MSLKTGELSILSHDHIENTGLTRLEKLKKSLLMPALDRDLAPYLDKCDSELGGEFRLLSTTRPR
jgi:hypothetical protein